MFPLYLLLASAGAMAQTTPQFNPDDETMDKARLAACQQMVDEAERSQGTSGIVTGWEECLKRLDAADPIRPTVEQRLALARIESDHSRLKAGDAAGYAKVLLATVAQYPTIELPMDEVRAQWVMLSNDADFRLTLDGARTVAVRVYPMNGITEDDQDALGEQVRRYITEAGFKTPEPSSADASNADIFVNIEPNLETLDPLGATNKVIIYAERSTLKASTVKFKVRDSRGAAIEIAVETSDLSDAVAREMAIDQSASAFADAFMMRVITELFADFDISSVQ